MSILIIGVGNVGAGIADKINEFSVIRYFSKTMQNYIQLLL